MNGWKPSLRRPLSTSMVRGAVDTRHVLDAALRDPRALVQRSGLADRPEDGLARCERSARERTHAGRGGLGAFPLLFAVAAPTCFPPRDDQRVRGRVVRRCGRWSALPCPNRRCLRLDLGQTLMLAPSSTALGVR